MQSQLPAFTFRETRDLKDKLSTHYPGIREMSLPDFAGYLNRETQTEAFNAAKTDNLFMRTSAGIDDFLDWTKLPEFTESLGGWAGGLVGEEAIGREAGRAIPRGIVNLAPAFLGPYGIAATVGLSALDAYEKTGGSVGAALASGALAGATLPVARAGGQIALKALGETGTDAAGKALVASTLARRAAEIGAENVAAGGMQVVGGETQSLIAGQGLYNPVSKEALVETVIGNLPFTVLDAYKFAQPLAQPKGAGIEQTKTARVAQELTETLPEKPVVLREDLDTFIQTGAASPRLIEAFRVAQEVKDAHANIAQAEDTLVQLRQQKETLVPESPEAVATEAQIIATEQALKDASAETAGAGENLADINLLSRLTEQQNKLQARLRENLSDEERRQTLSKLARVVANKNIVTKTKPSNPLSQLLNPEMDAKLLRLHGSLDSMSALLDFVDMFSGADLKGDPVEIAKKRAASFVLSGNEETYGGKLSPEEIVTRTRNALGYDVELSVLQERSKALESFLGRNYVSPREAGLHQKLLSVEALRPEYSKAASDWIKQIAFDPLSEESTIKARLSWLEGAAAQAEKQGKTEAAKAFREEIRRVQESPEEAERAPTKDGIDPWIGEEDQITLDLEQAGKEAGIDVSERRTQKKAQIDVSDFTEEVYSLVLQMQQQGVAPDKIANNISLWRLKAQFLRNNKNILRDFYFERGEGGEAVYPTFSSKEAAAVKAEELNSSAESGETYTVFMDRGAWKIMKYTYPKQAFVEGWDAHDRINFIDLADAEGKLKQLGEATQEKADLTIEEALESLESTEKQIAQKSEKKLDPAFSLYANAILARQKRLLAIDPTISDTRRIETSVVAELMLDPEFWIPSQRRKVKTFNHEMLIKAFELAGVPLNTGQGNALQNARTKFKAAQRILQGYVNADSPTADPIMMRILRNTEEYQRYRKNQALEHANYSFETYQVKEAIEHFESLGTGIDGRVKIEAYDTLEQARKAHPDLIQSLEAAGYGHAEGFYSPEQKRIVLITEGIRPRAGEASYTDAAHRLLLHEVIGHWGIESVLGNKFQALLRTIVTDYLTEAEKAQIKARYHMITDDQDIFIAEEYLAARADSYGSLQKMGKMREFSKMRMLLGEIKKYATKVFGEDTPFTYANGRAMMDFEILKALKASRDFTLKKRGLTALVGTGETVTGPLDERPSDLLDGSRASLPYWQTKPTYNGLDNGAKNAYETLVKLGRTEGLDLDEAHRKAVQVQEVFTKPDSFYDLQPGKNVIVKPGAWSVSNRGTTKQLWARAKRAQLLSAMFEQAEKVSEGPLHETRIKATSYLQKYSPLEQADLVRGALGEMGVTVAPVMADASLGLKQLTNGLLQLTIDGKVGKIKEQLLHAPEELGNYLIGTLKEVNSIRHFGQALASAEDLGITNKKGLTKLELQALTDMGELNQALIDIDASIQRDAKTLSAFSNFDPVNLTQALVGADTEVPILSNVTKQIRASNPTAAYRAVPEMEPDAPGWLRRTTDLPSNIVERYPEYGNLYRVALSYQAKSQEAIEQAFSHLGIKIQGATVQKTDTYKIIQRVGSSEAMSRGFSALARAQNEKVERNAGFGGYLGSGRLTPDEVARLRLDNPDLQHLSPQNYQHVVLAFEAMSRANGAARETILKSYSKKINNLAATFIAEKLGWTNLHEAQKAADAIEALVYTPEGQTPITINQLKKPEGTDAISNDVFYEAARSLVEGQGEEAGLASKFHTFASYMRQRDGYFPEFRLGEYTIQFKDSLGHIQTLGVDTYPEVIQKAKALREAGNTNVKYLGKKQARRDASVLSKGALTIAAEIENSYFEQLRSVVGDEVFEKHIVPNYEPLHAAMQAEHEKTMQDYLKKRTLAKGREHLDLFKVNTSYLPAVAYGAARSYVRSFGNFYLREASLQDNPVLQDYGRTHLENTLRSTGGLERAIKESAFQYTMALNVSTMAFESLQTLSTLAPFLTQQGAGFFGSYKEIYKSIDLLIQAKMKKRFADEELESLTQRAMGEGVISRGFWQEVEDPTGAVGALQDVMSGSHLLEQSKRLGRAYLNMTRNLYGMASHTNETIAFIAGVLRGRKRGLEGEALYDYALRTTHVTMFGGGKANRSVGLYSGDKGSQPLRVMVGALQRYFQGMTWTMVRSLEGSFDRTLTKAQRRTNRLATAQLFGTQLALAGILGMPGTAAATAILEQLFPDLQLKRSLEEIPKTLLNHSALGNWIVDTALYGVPTASSPIDVSGRIGLEQMLGVNQLSGFDSSAFFGPVGSIITQLSQGAQSFVQGDYIRAAEKISPVAVKNVIKAVKDGGNIRSYSGNLVGTMSDSERFLQALGFRPKWVSDAQEAKRHVQKAVRIENKAEQTYIRTMAGELLAGNPQAVRESLFANLRKDPMYSIKAQAEKIARKATEMSTPAELGRHQGRANTVSDLLRTFATEANRQSAFRRNLAKLSFGASLGVTSPRDLQSLRFGATQDALRAAQPQLTFDQTSGLLTGQLSPLGLLTF